MAIKIDVKKFEELLQIQQERQLAMKELSEKLGIDISFSDEEVMKVFFISVISRNTIFTYQI